MSRNFRTVALSAGLATLAAGALATPQFFPQAFADEPQSHLLDTARDLFPPAFDPGKLRKFDITLGDGVSTAVQSTQFVTKIGYGHKTEVAIVTTPSGTYSSDAITSPHVRYPGIEVAPRDDYDDDNRPGVRISNYSSTWGKSSSLSVHSGSFTYYSSTFTPARRHR